jgi:hypothetical protein
VNRSRWRFSSAVRESAGTWRPLRTRGAWPTGAGWTSLNMLGPLEEGSGHEGRTLAGVAPLTSLQPKPYGPITPSERRIEFDTLEFQQGTLTLRECQFDPLPNVGRSRACSASSA